jgi:hypothetical protein
MEFALVCIGMIVVVGAIALIANHFDKGDDEITVAHDCATCTAAQEGDCKIHCLLEEKKKKEVEQGGSCTGDGT